MDALRGRKRLEEWMRMALAEGRASLRGGDRGFGALVISGGGDILGRAHDTDTTDGDPTAHAEMGAIRAAAASTGGRLAGCLLVATHEPCPMCAAAALWAGIEEMAFGLSIREAIAEGRRRIDLPAAKIFELGGRELTVHAGLLRDECAVLYNRAVRKEIAALRGAGADGLERLAAAKAERRVAWFQAEFAPGFRPSGSVLDDAYAVFLARLGIGPEEARRAVRIVERTPTRLVIRSDNFCPTLEACRILGLDTREVCRRLTEGPTTALLRQIHPGLRFRRNDELLRPYAPFCEEMIELTPGG
jgi:tRNA(Arg) A34 adenosine deaminase TadA